MRTLRESLLDDFEAQADDLRRYKMIENWLRENNREKHAKFKISKDFTISIDEFVYNGKGNFPEYIRFGKCTNNFILEDCDMTSLRGCPSYVGGSFSCHGNKLTDLEYSPEYVEMDYVCSRNRLKTLKGMPEEIIWGDFMCDHNQLTDLKGGPHEVATDYYCNNNKLKTLDGAPTGVRGDFICSNNPLSSWEVARLANKVDYSIIF